MVDRRQLHYRARQPTESPIDKASLADGRVVEYDMGEAQATINGRSVVFGGDARALYVRLADPTLD